MPVGFSAVRSALKTRLQTISGLTVYATAPGQVNPPAAIILPGEPLVSYDSTMARGSDDLQMVIRVLVAPQIDYASQDDLDVYLAGSGASSVKEAVDGNLGGTVDFARVVLARNYGDFDHNGVTYLGVEFVVEVTA